MGNGHHKDHYLGICALIIQQIRRDLISAFCRFVRVNDEIDRANGIALRLLREGRQKASVKSISFWAEKTVDVSRQLNAIEQLPQDRRAATTMVLVREQGRVYLSKLYCLEFGKLLAKRRTQLVELYGFGCIRDEDSVTNDAAPPGPAMNKQCRGVPTDRPCITSARTHPRRSRLCTTRVHGSSSIRHGGDPAGQAVRIRAKFNIKEEGGHNSTRHIPSSRRTMLPPLASIIVNVAHGRLVSMWQT
jgi:hypothetical protein